MLYLKMHRSLGARLGRIGFIAFLVLACFAITVPGVALAQDGGRYGRDDGKHSRGYDGGYSDYDHQCVHTHFIKAGENLSRIADRYHVPVDLLAHANGIKDADLIVEGQKLCIPHYSGHDGYGKDSYGKDSYGKDGYGKDSYGYGYDGYGKDGYGDHKSGSVRWSDDHDRYGKDGYGKDGYGKDGYGYDGYGKDGYGKDSYGYGYDYDYDYGYDDHYGKQDGHRMSDADYARKYGSVRWSDGHHAHDHKYDYDYGYKGYDDYKYKDGYDHGWD